MTFEARPCPCGYHGSPIKECRCTAGKIERHRAKLPVADITIEVLPPAARDLDGRPGTSSDHFSYILAGYQQFPSLELNDVCRNLLKAACAELGIDADSRGRIVAITRTVANLDHSETIQPAHLSEAINYRAFRR